MGERPGPIVVAGATGNQGGAVVRQLLARGFAVRAMTRDPHGEKAARLQAAGAEIVQADFLERPSLMQALEGAQGAFSVQSRSPVDPAVAAMQGYAFADAAKAAGLRHLIYSSVGGADRASGCDYAASKWAIEEHIRRIGVPATILRPALFIDSLTAPGAAGQVAWGAVAWALRGGRKLQLLALDDLGAFVALVLADAPRYLGQAIELAGDEVSLAELRAASERAGGRRKVVLPLPPRVVALFDRDLAQLCEWLRTASFSADVAALRQLLPTLKRAEEGLRRPR